jgi:alcohol dehydrogenase
MSNDGNEATPRKIWRIERPGNLKQLRQLDDLLPPPSSGEITVRVECVGLNFADVFTVLGMYDAAPRDKPVIPGLEFCGVIEAVGDRKGVPKAKVSRSPDGSR